MHGTHAGIFTPTGRRLSRLYCYNLKHSRFNSLIKAKEKPVACKQDWLFFG
jgi:hypothetical protein